LSSINLKSFAAIGSPIPLLALFGGISELIIGALVWGVAPQYQLYVVAGAILLPLAWLIVIFLLIARYHYFLYAPKDFPKPEHFLETVSVNVRSMLNNGTLGKPTEFAPFRPSEIPSAGDWKAMARKITESALDDLLRNADAAELLALHTLHNEEGAHTLALQALTLAIAKGLAASKNYSFASASLRKLGRYTEARGFASLALDVDGGNVDAHYNLALVCKAMGLHNESLRHAREVLVSGGNYHQQRIHQEFPKLIDATQP
jgi:tetratricopeptide (TPR) repeat protein